MTAAERKVRERYPDAACTVQPEDGHYAVRTLGTIGFLLGCGFTERRAWSNAASLLPAAAPATMEDQ